MRFLQQRSGIALPTVLVVMVVVGSVAAAAAVMGSTSFVMAMHDERMGTMVAAADAGLEFGRARLNGDRTLYPDSNFVTIENGVAVRDNAGNVMPGLTRWTYAGPIGITTGQYGVFGSVVAVVQNSNGDRVIRRLEVIQESFAKYAYFTDFDASTGIVFGGGDVLLGPVHSNDDIEIHWTGATFQDRVTTAGQIINQGNGTFNGPLIENAPAIPMPQTADLNRLRDYATAGSTRIVGDNNGAAGTASTRIEFIAIDLNGDTDTSDEDEGFMRVYRSANEAWVTATEPADMTDSNNCGDWHGSTFHRTPPHPIGGHGETASLKQGNDSRCYLGGAPELFNGFQANDAVGPGSWLPWTGTVDPRLSTAGHAADAAYLWPLSRALNPNFKGVVFVDGKVVISGTLRARITLAATNDIIIGDDVEYVTNPGTVSCNDILGLFSGTDVVIAHNTINAPVYFDSNWRHYEAGDRDERLDGVVLALDEFRAQGHNLDPNGSQPCDGSLWARGCLRLTGGVIQRTRGAVGTTGYTGYLKRYDYDRCAASDPPPYFPTTGIFARSRYFEVDPTGFNIATYFATLTP
jgi:type II secretory pathway pseudopilin PulG